MIPHVWGMTDDDLDSLAAYMGTLPLAKHAVPEPALPPEAQKLMAQ